MSSSTLRAAAVACALTLVTACFTPMIKKVESSDYGNGPRAGTTMKQIKATIEKVATTRSWTLSNASLGQFTGKRAWGGEDHNKHNIVVDVVYDLKTFSIRYKDSKRMKYDGSSIHPTYNYMILLLEEGIQEAVSKL